MSVILQLSAEDNIVSETIRTWTRGNYSHVDIVMPSGTLLGARSDGGVQIRQPNYAPFTTTKRVMFGGGKDWDDAFYTFLMEQIGKPYDTWAVAGLALDRDWRHPDKWFCSELAAAALEQGHFILPLSTGFSFISPRDIELIASILGG